MGLGSVTAVAVVADLAEGASLHARKDSPVHYQYMKR